MKIQIKHKFDICPCTAPRMTKRDAIFINPNHADPKKRQRPAVTKYFAYKRMLNALCLRDKVKLDSQVNVCFVIPMPESWSKKKKEEMNNKPHQQTPDIDNLFKAFMDSFGNNDNYVWNTHLMKVWGYTGKILIFE